MSDMEKLDELADEAVGRFISIQHDVTDELRANMDAAFELGQADLRAEVEDWREGARKAAEEPCGDEKHCTCVPALRSEVTKWARSTQDNAKLYQDAAQRAEKHRSECDALRARLDKVNAALMPFALGHDHNTQGEVTMHDFRMASEAFLAREAEADAGKEA